MKNDTMKRQVHLAAMRSAAKNARRPRKLDAGYYSFLAGVKFCVKLARIGNEKFCPPRKSARAKARG